MKGSARFRLKIRLIVVVLAAIGLVLAGCSNSGGPVTPTSPTASSPTSSGATATIDLIAQNTTFNLKSIGVPARADVTINFTNKDAGMPHNFALYQNLANGQTGAVFVGEVITGPATATYKFKAPDAQGSYFFECDVHPQVMNGQFVVTP